MASGCAACRMPRAEPPFPRRHASTDPCVHMDTSANCSGAEPRRCQHSCNGLTHHQLQPSWHACIVRIHCLHATPKHAHMHPSARTELTRRACRSASRSSDCEREPRLDAGLVFVHSRSRLALRIRARFGFAPHSFPPHRLLTSLTSTAARTAHLAQHILCIYALGAA